MTVSTKSRASCALDQVALVKAIVNHVARTRRKKLDLIVYYKKQANLSLTIF